MQVGVSAPVTATGDNLRPAGCLGVASCRRRAAQAWTTRADSSHDVIIVQSLIANTVAWSGLLGTVGHRHTHSNDLCVYNSDKDSIDNAILDVSYANGVRLTFSFATTGERHERSFTLTGQRGHIHDSQAGGTIVIEPKGKEPQTILMPQEFRDEHGGGDELLMDSFLECVASGQQPPAEISAGLASVVLGVGATRSIEHGGEPVDLQGYLSQVG